MSRWAGGPVSAWHTPPHRTSSERENGKQQSDFDERSPGVSRVYSTSAHPDKTASLQATPTQKTTTTTATTMATKGALVCFCILFRPLKLSIAEGNMPVETQELTFYVHVTNLLLSIGTHELILAFLLSLKNKDEKKNNKGLN